MHRHSPVSHIHRAARRRPRCVDDRRDASRMFLPSRALMESQHGLITSRQLAAQGVTHQDVRRLLRAEVLVRVRHGVYADAEVWQGLNPYREQPMMRVRAAALTLKATSFVFSHDSAAIMLGMGAPRPEASLV